MWWSRPVGVPFVSFPCSQQDRKPNYYLRVRIEGDVLDTWETGRRHERVF